MNIKKALNFIAVGNILLVGAGSVLMIFVMMYTISPLDKGEFADPLIWISAGYMLALVFGIAALKNKLCLIGVLFGYVVFVGGYISEQRQVDHANDELCTRLRAEPSCVLKDYGAYECGGGLVGTGAYPSDMCKNIK